MGLVEDFAVPTPTAGFGGFEVFLYIFVVCPKSLEEKKNRRNVHLFMNFLNVFEICFLDVGGTAFLLIQDCFQVARIHPHPQSIWTKNAGFDIKQNMEISNPHEKMKKNSGFKSN